MPKSPAWKKILKTMYKHPYITIGSTVAPVVAFKAITGAANTVHDTYNIASQHSQKELLKKQLDVLKILAQSKELKSEAIKGDISTKMNPAEKSSYYRPKELVKKERGYY